MWADVPKVDDLGAIDGLRAAAIRSHQQAVGAGDELVRLLERTVKQLEAATRRVHYMSTALFVVGLLVFLAGVIQLALGNVHTVWSAVISTAGGLAAFAAVFWTAPLNRVTAATTTLVKLETVFLGYIRAIGELYSAFQMQYLDALAESVEERYSASRDDQPPLPHSKVRAMETVDGVEAMMAASLRLISKYVDGREVGAGDVEDDALRLRYAP
jgi:hypothetical protein